MIASRTNRPPAPPAPPPTARARLVELRGQLIERIAETGVEPGFLSLLGGAHLALLALDDAEAAAETGSPRTTLTIGDDGREITATMHDHETGRAMSMTLDTAYAVEISGQLLRSVSTRMRM